MGFFTTSSDTDIVEAKKGAFNRWEGSLSNAFKELENYYYQLENFFEDGNLSYLEECRKYPIIVDRRERLVKLTDRDKQQYDEKYNEIVEHYKIQLYNLVFKHLVEDPGTYHTKNSVYALKLYKWICYNNKRYDESINSLTKYYNQCIEPFIYIKQESYGHFSLIFDDVQVLKNYDSKIDEIYNSVLNRLEESKKPDISITKMSSFYTPDLIYQIAECLWYYAKKQPNSAKYNQVKETYMKYVNFKEPEEITQNIDFYYYKFSYPDFSHRKIGMNVETLIADCYIKNQMGGENVIKLEWNFISQWIDEMHSQGFDNQCHGLASGFAWLKLYNLERDVLRKMVKMGIVLTSYEEKRLNFLESGGTTPMDVYKVPHDYYFYFDRSAVDWNEKKA
ncbi:MAG: hypothetical protein LUG12_10520 [Erysipelotrichaceae bacterium]|nr:hypothetical protein [Erysipelotrichaceae bacterium]